MSSIVRSGELLKPVRQLIEPVLGVIAKIDGWATTGEFRVYSDPQYGYLRFGDLGENALSRSARIEYGYDFSGFSLHDFDRLQLVTPDSVVELLSRREGWNSVGYNF